MEHPRTKVITKSKHNAKDQTTERRVVLSLTRMTVHNGPGLRSLVLFKGCSLRCIWCSTPESQDPKPEIALDRKRCNQCRYCIDACPQSAIGLTTNAISINRVKCNDCGECTKVCYNGAIRLLGISMTIDELVHELEKDAIFFKHSGGGVTISGGEPLLEPDFTSVLLKGLKQRGIGTGVDTCGHVPWSNINKVLPYVDFFLWDIKHMDCKKHREFTGADNKLILHNTWLVSESGIPLYIRIPIIPGYNDSEENIEACCKFASSLHSIVEVHLLPVHHLGRARYESLDRPYPIAEVAPVSDDKLLGIKQLVESFGLQCRING